MTTTPTHAAPWTFRRFLAMFTGQTSPRRRAARPGVTHVLTGREAAARMLYGESVHWSTLDMLNYDANGYLQSYWLHVADRRIEHAASSDRFVAAHHGITPDAWCALSALAKVDLRESFYEAKGMGL